jgi:LmbE family N-acetylglucosaminyl deacetylase
MVYPTLYPAPGEVTVERAQPGRPHAGKVLAAIQAHSDDIPFYCAGTLAKLIAEGYTGYLIQTSNDEKCGPTPRIGDTVAANERDVDELARVLGLQRVFHLSYRNHRMDGDSALELRCRLILLFRLLKVDTVFTFNPWGINEENPDHWVTARAVEAACWMSGADKDYPEQLAAGLQPHGVRERYYWAAREGQTYNRVVDVSAHEQAKVEAYVACRTQGPGGAAGSRLRAELAARGLRLPELGQTDDASDRAYVRLFLLERERALGSEHGLGLAEAFYYLGPRANTAVDDYVAEHAVKT